MAQAVDPALAHQREQPVQVRRLGRGQRRLDVLAGDPGADGADHGRPDAGPLQAALGQAGGRGLALGAGHADHPHRRGRVAVDARGQPAEHRAGPVDDQQRHAAAPARSAPAGSVSIATAPAAERRPARSRCRGRGRPAGRRTGRRAGSAASSRESPVTLVPAGSPRVRDSPSASRSHVDAGRRAGVRQGRRGRVAASRSSLTTRRGYRSGRRAAALTSPLDREPRGLGARRRHPVAAQRVAHDLRERRARRPSHRRRRCAGFWTTT